MELGGDLRAMDGTGEAAVTLMTVIQSLSPRRLTNAEMRSREYLTPAEIEKLIKAAKDGRWGLRDA